MYFLCPMKNWFCNRDNSTVLFLHYLTSCNIDLCGGFAANLVVIIQITLLFILKFSSQLKRSQCLRFIYCYFSKNIAAGESRWNSECGWKYRNAGVTRQMRVTWHICVIKVANLNLESNQSLKVIYWSNQKVWKSFPKPSTYVVLNLQSK